LHYLEFAAKIRDRSQGTSFKRQVSMDKSQGTRFKIQGTRFKDQDLGGGGAKGIHEIIVNIT